MTVNEECIVNTSTHQGPSIYKRPTIDLIHTKIKDLAGWEGFGCAVRVMLATLGCGCKVLFQSVASDGRATPTQTFSPSPRQRQYWSGGRKTRYSPATRSVFYFERALQDNWTSPRRVTLRVRWIFFPSLSTSTELGGKTFPLFRPRRWLVKESRLWPSRLELKPPILDGSLLVRISGRVFPTSTSPPPLVFECVANMMMSPTPLFPEVMAEHNFSNFSW